MKADSEAPSGRYRLLAAVLGRLGIFVGQDVGSYSTRSVESDWLPVEKLSNLGATFYGTWISSECLDGELFRLQS